MLSHKLGEDVTVVRDYGTSAATHRGDPGLNQVWTNLIDNAIDAMDGKRNPPHRHASRRRGARGRDRRYRAEMPPEVQARAFEPFFTTKEIGRGTGLGLDISRRIIFDRHHGSIAIESSPQGTVLRVRLPRDRAVRSAPDTTDRRALSLRGHGARHRATTCVGARNTCTSNRRCSTC